MEEKTNSALEEIIKLEQLFVIRPKLANPRTYERRGKLTEDSPEEYTLLKLAGFTVESNEFHVQTSEGMKIGVKSDCFGVPKLYLQAKLPLEKIKDVFGDYHLDWNSLGLKLTYYAGDEHIKYRTTPFEMTFSQAFDVKKVGEAFLKRVSDRFNHVEIGFEEFTTKTNEKIEEEFNSFRKRAASIYQRDLLEFFSQIDAISCTFDIRRNWELKDKYRSDCESSSYDSEISINRNEVTIKLSSDPLNPEGLRYYLEKFQE